MDWSKAILQVIDLRSFSSLWYWVLVAVTWSTISNWVLGVPWDMVMRARKDDTEARMQDLETIVRININRILLIAEESGLLLAGLTCFMLTMLMLLGFVYGNEFSQAVFLLLFPMTIVGLLSVATAHVIRRDGLSGEALYRMMHKHRVLTQVVGVISIFVTAMWGMLQNMMIGALG